MYAANDSSNSSSLGPRLSWEVRSTLVTALMSSSVISGLERGIFIAAVRQQDLERLRASSVMSHPSERRRLLPQSFLPHTHPHMDFSFPPEIHGTPDFGQTRPAAVCKPVRLRHGAHFAHARCPVAESQYRRREPQRTPPP